MNLRLAKSIRLFLLGVLLLLIAWGFSACAGSSSKLWKSAEPPRALEVMSVAWEENLVFEEGFFRSFGQRNGLKTEYVANARLALYQRLLHAHSTQPDLLEIDVVWPAILADDLIDLRPYVKDGLRAFPSELLSSYTVNGRLVALPLYIDMGVLFYRPELLTKYGFQRPPDTWEDLETMASRIQQGERRAGKKDFWAFVWEGALYEGLTCNALEWQSAAGAGNFIEPGGVVHVRSALLAAALRRAAHWLGTISPPAEYVYWSDDAMNIWDAGQTAFMRNWASSYRHVAERSAKNSRGFGLAPLPKGLGGHRGALGGLAMGVSKYAANREMAIKALLELTDESHDLARLQATDGIPTHLAVAHRADVKSRTSLLAALSEELLTGLVARPSAITGAKYDEVSREYWKAVNSVLRREATPEVALANLEKTLVTITGMPARSD